MNRLLIITLLLFTPLKSEELNKKELYNLLKGRSMRKIHNKIIYKGVSKGLSYTGNGHGYTNKLVSKQTYLFSINQLVDKEKAKKIITELISYAVEVYNSEPTIAPIYLEYPISSDSISIAIYFEDKQQKEHFVPHMCSIMKIEDSFLFCYKDNPEASILDERIEKEPFPRITFGEGVETK
ncbi:MAG: hypothetical protein CMO81_01915 [Waddliaceae bacterium]|nr:hypothetical protein [Waddliaceae bacterium]